MSTINAICPPITNAEKITTDKRRLYIGTYGFEDRSVGWTKYQLDSNGIISSAIVIKYVNTKFADKNKIDELKENLGKLGVNNLIEIEYNKKNPIDIEEKISRVIQSCLDSYEEIIVDISAMTKLLILVTLCSLETYSGPVRIIYSEPVDYAPDRETYEASKKDMELMAKYPSIGVSSIIRTKCLSSVRMQGQPVTLVAFTSFNEQLVRHILGTLSPHRLIFINGRPPRSEYRWREIATIEIHKTPIDEYFGDNPFDEKGELKRTVSTMDYSETIVAIDGIYKEYGAKERIICAATGSKMQTIGLFFSKIMHQDIHIEYPTPDSYYVLGMSTGVRAIHEILINNFASLINDLANPTLEKTFLDE